MQGSKCVFLSMLITVLALSLAPGQELGAADASQIMLFDRDATSGESPIKTLNLPFAGPVSAVVTGEKVLEDSFQPLDTGYIVELKGKPVAPFLQELKRMLTGPLAGQVQSYAQELRSSQQSVIEQVELWEPQAKIGRQFIKLFNGFALTCSLETAARLREHPQVKEVWRNRVVKATVQTTVPRIRANLVVTDLGIDGSGTKVAIVDTGIDYNHDALKNNMWTNPGEIPENGIDDDGNGLVDDYYGYNFVNLEADPRDDNGHGTHVAGIVGGFLFQIKEEPPPPFEPKQEIEILFQGVAPGTQLMAVKVLDAAGGGTTEQIIAGVEYAVDPDGNPLTMQDAADVINMSLGGPGRPGDPMSTAVENAVQMGVTVVVAAGNEGPESHTIGSPGCAPSVVTVGATEKYADELAEFSSRGPNAVDFSRAVQYSVVNKPDVCAPGVSINSTLPNQGYGYASGTSMAAPHVAGVAALIKQLYPGFLPQQVKALVMNNALTMTDAFTPLSPTYQGSGRLEAMNSMIAPCLLTPASISIWNNPEELSFADVIPVTIINTTEEPLIFNFVVSTYAHRRQSVAPSSVNLSPGQSAIVEFRVECDNDQLADGIYYDFINVETSYPVLYKSKAHIPVAISKLPILEVTCQDFVADQLLVTNVNSGRTFYAWYETRYGWVVPGGTYDIIAYRYDVGNDEHMVLIKEQVEVKGYTQVNLATAEASNEVKLSFRDVVGNPLEQVYNLYFGNRLAGVAPLQLLGTEATIHTNSFSSRSWLEAYGCGFAPNGLHFVYVRTPAEGVSSSLSLTNDLAQFGITTLKYYTRSSEDAYISVVPYIGSEDMRTSMWPVMPILSEANAFSWSCIFTTFDDPLTDKYWKGVQFMSSDQYFRDTCWSSWYRVDTSYNLVSHPPFFFNRIEARLDEYQRVHLSEIDGIWLNFPARSWSGRVYEWGGMNWFDGPMGWMTIFGNQFNDTAASSWRVYFSRNDLVPFYYDVMPEMSSIPAFSDQLGFFTIWTEDELWLAELNNAIKIKGSVRVYPTKPDGEPPYVLNSFFYNEAGKRGYSENYYSKLRFVVRDNDAIEYVSFEIRNPWDPYWSAQPVVEVEPGVYEVTVPPVNTWLGYTRFHAEDYAGNYTETETFPFGETFKTWDFESADKGWFFRTFDGVATGTEGWEDGVMVDDPHALGIDSGTSPSADYFACWDTLQLDPGRNIPYLPNTLYRVVWSVSTDQDNANQVPQLRLRASTLNQKFASFVYLYPGSFLPFPKRPDMTDYHLFYQPAINDPAGNYLAWDYIDWTDDFRGTTNGPTYVEEVRVDCFDLSQIAGWQLQNKVTPSDMGSWKELFYEPYDPISTSSLEADGLHLTTPVEENFSVGGWGTRAVFTLQGGYLYRYKVTLACDDQVACPPMRFRIQTYEYRYSTYFLVQGDKQSTALPPASGRDYFIYAYDPYPDRLPCFASWEMIDLSSGKGGEAVLKGLEVHYHKPLP